MKKLTPVSHLLAEAEGMLQKLRRGTAEADRTLAALQRILPPEIAREVWSASRRGATLTAFVQTAAWEEVTFDAPALAPISYAHPAQASV